LRGLGNSARPRKGVLCGVNTTPPRAKAALATVTRGQTRYETGLGKDATGCFGPCGGRATFKRFQRFTEKWLALW